MREEGECLLCRIRDDQIEKYKGVYMQTFAMARTVNLLFIQGGFGRGGNSHHRCSYVTSRCAGVTILCSACVFYVCVSHASSRSQTCVFYVHVSPNYRVRIKGHIRMRHTHTKTYT